MILELEIWRADDCGKLEAWDLKTSETRYCHVLVIDHFCRTFFSEEFGNFLSSHFWISGSKDGAPAASWWDSAASWWWETYTPGLQSLWHSWWHSITWGYCNLVQSCLHWWKWRSVCQPIPSAWLVCVRITLDMLANTHTHTQGCLCIHGSFVNCDWCCVFIFFLNSWFFPCRRPLETEFWMWSELQQSLVDKVNAHPKATWKAGFNDRFAHHTVIDLESIFGGVSRDSKPKKY